MITDVWVFLKSSGNTGTAMLTIIDDELVAELQLQDADVAFAPSPFFESNTGGVL